MGATALIQQYSMTALLLICLASLLTSAGAIQKEEPESGTQRQPDHRKLTSEVTLSCTIDSPDCYDLSGNNFQLTEETIFDSKSAIWSNTLVNLEDSFTIEADIMMHSPTYVGGEGMALVFQTQGTHALGEGGNGKGYQGISPCVVIDIDTHHGDTDDGTISIAKDSPSNVLVGSTNIGYIKDLRIRTLLVEYDAFFNIMTVHFDGKEVLSGPVDLQVELVAVKAATWGFTASSGASLSSDQWVYFKKFENGTSGPPAQSAAAPTTSVYLEEDFNTGSPAWIYRPNLLQGSLEGEAFVVGEKSPTRFGKWRDGFSSGGLRLQLHSGAEPNNAVSGGWKTTFLLEEDVQSATLDFKYQALFTGFTEEESGQVLIDVNDGPTATVETFQGGNHYPGLWESATVDLGFLPAGTYQIKIGGLLDAPTTPGRLFQIRFDNLSITGVRDNDVN